MIDLSKETINDLIRKAYNKGRKETLKDLKELIERELNRINLLIRDYGYCTCKLKEKDFHMSVVKDLEKLKKELIKELEKAQEIFK